MHGYLRDVHETFDAISNGYKSSEGHGLGDGAFNGIAYLVLRGKDIPGVLGGLTDR